MSWLARSLANTLILEDEDGDEQHDVPPTTTPLHPTPSLSSKLESQQQQQDHPTETYPDDEAQSRGVREDLTEFKQTLTRQLWGVASFLAPPPSHPSTPSNSRPDQSISDWNQLELSNRSISGEEPEPSDPNVVLKMDSNYDVYGSEEQEYYVDDFGRAVGITKEVLAFARNIAMHPETWLDFPLDVEEDTGDFDLSDAQKEHAFTVEHLAPRLAALRIELCPCHMSECYFWKVYFVLLYSRLDKHDAEILSTPQLVGARAMWMQMLQKQTKQESNWFGRSASALKDRDNVLSPYTHPENRLNGTFFSEPSTPYASTTYRSHRHQVGSNELHFIDKSVIVEMPVMKTEDKYLTGSSSKILAQYYEEDEDDWPEEDSEFGGCSGTAVHFENEEDISFSDLEEDDDATLPRKPQIAIKIYETSIKKS